MRSRCDQLLRDLAEEEARHAALEREYEIARDRIALLRERLAEERGGGRLQDWKRSGPGLPSTPSPSPQSLIREAIELHVEALREGGEPVPPPSSSVEYVEIPSAA